MKKMLTGFIFAAAVMAPLWAQAAAPSVDNNGGASNVLSISATLNGTLTSTGGVPTEVSVYWGSVDGGTVFGAWNHVDHLGTNGVGLLSQDVMNLTPNKKYYYRFFATNSTGSAWAAATTNFQTQASSGPLPVELGEAAHFTILAGAEITTTGGGMINGDVGAYPIAGSAIGIPPTQVNGIIYARDATGTQASNVVIDADLLLRAKNDMHTAWVDAAGRTPVPSGDRLNPQGGNLGGLTLVPGLYKITTVAYITGSDLTLVGGPDDVWIFMCDQNLEVGSGIKVILAGGALAKNIFWQVGTSATLGTGSVFKGTIIADAAVTMMSTSTMEGRALAFTEGVTFDGTGGTLPLSGKAINPTPAHGATNQVISATTSWENGGGATSYDVYFGTNAIPGIAEFQTNQTNTVFDPGLLAYTNTYYWRIDSLNGGGISEGDVWMFTTASQPSGGIVRFSSTTNSVLENGGAVTVTVARVSGSFGAASVNYATSNGTAIAGTNYTATSGTLNWIDGETAAKTFTVAILDDSVFGGNKTFTVALSSATNATIGIPALQTVTIREDDPPEKAINPVPAHGATNQLISTTASWANGGGATSYDVYFGTNPAPAIAEFKTNQTTLSYSPGTLGYGNTYYWRIDSLNANGSTPGDVWSFTTASTPSGGTVQFSRSTNSVLENGSSVTVTVTRLSGSFGAAAVNYATSDGTAIAGTAYTATSGTLNWTDGEISAKTFTVPILDNSIYEGDKTFTVALSGATGASLGIPALQTVTIVEDDAPAELLPPVIQILVPTTNTTYTSLTNLLDFGGTAVDDTGVTHVTLRNSRDVAEYTATLVTTNWSFTGLPLYQGTNQVTAVAYDASGNSAADTVQVVYTGDKDYDNVLRSGNIVQEIVFPDNLIPGETVTVQWKVLSYVPIVSRIYGGVPGGWFFYQNAVYKGMTVSTWNLNGRPANLYAFECAWVVPQKSGDFSAWFNVAQMDADQFMIPVIPDGVDSRPDPVYPKLIQRTVLAGGTGANPVSDPDTWDKANIFETIAQHKARSAVTITSMSMPDNLIQGELVTCEWKVQSYIDVNAQVLMLNLATSNLWVTTAATQIGTPVKTTFYFVDRVSGERFYAKEYTFRASFLVPLQAGDQQLYFRSRASADPLSAWMAQNLAADVDPRPVKENGMYGRLIERTINP